jgi:hypothetical protein
VRSFLTVATPADSLALLSIAEMRAAAGVTGNLQDATLQRLSAHAAAKIMSHCNIAVGGGAEPTLLKETLVQTLYSVCVDQLILDRRHNVVITSVIQDGQTLTAADYMADPESGLVTRLSNDAPIAWRAAKIIVTYTAGFEDVPGDLKQAADDYLRALMGESLRDPYVKGQRTNIPGVEEVETSYWVGSVPGMSSEGAVPDIVAGSLKRFINPNIG